MKLFFSLILFLMISANAQAISIISDEETENWLYDILSPIFRTANLPLNKDHIHIVKDNSLNAFVGDKNHMFIHTGTLLKADNSNEIEGVLAHETGHIVGGHILRMKIKMQDMQRVSLTSLIAAAGAAVASGRGDTAIAVVLGTQSSLINAMSTYQISEERAADDTAIMLLHKNNKSALGLKDFMVKIQKENRLQGIEENSYFRTHPVTSERISFFQNNLTKENNLQNEKNLDARLKRIQTKLFAFLEPMDKVLKKYPLTDSSILANIAHTVYYMRQKNLNMAVNYADKLIEIEPLNPYFWELKAQSLYECGNIKGAIDTYKKLIKLSPKSDLFKLGYAEAVLALNSDITEQKKLISVLENINRNNSYPIAFFYLGQIYSNLGENSIADYYLAEYNYEIGELGLAKSFLAKAKKGHLRSDIAIRADDLDKKLTKEVKNKTLF